MLNLNNMKRPTAVLPLLLMLAFVADQLLLGTTGSPMQMQLAARPRYPRKDSYVAYNIHKSFKPRDVNSLDANQARKAMLDVQQTIAEVERLLALDPTLPRLTKGEIEELFENVTREELVRSLREGDQNRAQHMRALMLVLPYHTGNTNQDNLQAIYTLPPVTKVVEASPTHVYTDVLGITPVRQIATTTASTTTTTPRTTSVTQFPVFRHRSTTAASGRKPVSTTHVPITTIRFSTPKPTTFHPALPNKIREDPKPATTTVEPIKAAEINQILAAIGLGNGPPPTFKPLPVGITAPAEMGRTTTQQSINPSNSAESSEELKTLLRSFGLLHNDTDKVGITPVSPIEFHQIPEYESESQPSHLIHNEVPQVEELELETSSMAKPDIRPDDFVAFKPLPNDTPMLDEDLDQLLKSFGLLGNGERRKKSMKPETTAAPAVVVMTDVPMIDKDLVPQMASVLDTLGIHTMKKERTGRKYESKKNSNTIGMMKSNGMAVKTKKKADNEDYRKLEQLWETIRELEKLNINLTDASLDTLNLRNFNLSESLLAQGPNPLENLEQTRTNDIKKRQQPNQQRKPDEPVRISLDLGASNSTNITSRQVEIISTTTNSTTILDVASDADPPTSTTTTTESASSGSSSSSSSESAKLNTYEDSFGGYDVDPVAQQPLPQPSRNGFYFLADWNSFLEVGEDPNKVIINFRPRAGDPSRFLPVNVP
ncbi:mucin-2 isoform X2 [Malaya genurostris]|nr:mucin-2 isoform X2 [Malaya genurostris]